ncbi:hypothetical protein G6L37_05360 [Agrobacterium rubi]|nr:hypothetical protein [Agrobacterium rubi]NTF24785.1 hypothetical protein [Agrobacterium rubi]
MNEQQMIETSARVILIATGHAELEDISAWEDLSDRFYVQSRKGDVSGFAAPVVEAFRIARSITESLLPLPSPNPEITIKWVQEDDRTWTSAIADGWSAKVRQSMGDDTWSFIVNQSGRCYLDSRETAIRLAEENARERIEDAIRYAARTSRAFGLSLPVEEHEAAA